MHKNGLEIRDILGPLMLKDFLCELLVPLFSAAEDSLPPQTESIAPVGTPRLLVDCHPILLGLVPHLEIEITGR